MSHQDDLILCPYCREQNRADAISCWFCKFVFPPPVSHINTENAQMTQLEAFRSSFLEEVPNILAHDLTVNDALGLIVNVLGTALAVSRCQIYCTYDGKTGWHYSEYCHKEFEHSKSLGWLPSKSALIAKAVRTLSPISFVENDGNKIPQSVQKEFAQLQIQSALGISLPAVEKTSGCVILHQCDHPRQWLKDEMDWTCDFAQVLSTSLAKKAHT